MKIVYLADSVIPSRSANSVHVMKMCQAFAMAGHEVHLIVPNGKPGQQDTDDVFDFYGVERCFVLHRLPWPDCKTASRVWAWEAARVAQLLRPDLVYARHMLACLHAAEAGLPVVFEEHWLCFARRNLLRRVGGRIGDWSKAAVAAWHWARAGLPSDIRRAGLAAYPALIRSGGFAGLPRLFERLAAHPRLLRCVVITQALKRDIGSVFPELTEKLVVVPDGADLPCRPLPAVPFDDTGDVLHVGYCGHLYPGKGMELIAALIPRCPWARFHIVGGTEHDLAKWRQQLSHHANVRFYGYVEPSASAAYIARFDVCLLPNQLAVQTFGNKGIDIGPYTSPLKMFEYMAAGKPIVASDLSVLKEVLVHGYNAILCPHDAVETWTAALRQLGEDLELRRRLGKQALRDLRERYTWRARVDRVLPPLEQALGKR